ncbi:MAG: hypothetical protein Q8P81_02800 [Nanoarchaeota archaeon]|nr:hypothetical protein [Nanoarchaeota archaeon]
MKIKKEKGVLFLIGFTLVFSIALMSACNLKVILVNQDPYPVTPGEDVKLVFQVTGISDSTCGTVEFEIVEGFPFTAYPGTELRKMIESGVYSKDYNNFWLIPYTLRVDRNAKEGDNQLDVLLSKSSGEAKILNSFDINVKDVETDFEISVKNYNPATKRITFEILNSGKNDVEALSIELNSQDSVVLRGASTNIIGSLDSNDFTTAEFEATAEEGRIELMIHYTDIADIRRNMSETVYFNPEPFILKANTNGGSSVSTYVILVLVVGGIAYYFYRRRQKKEERHKLAQEHHRR